MEAIVLKSQDYREKARILTVYSKEQGRASLLVKGIGKRNSGLTVPPAHAMFTIKEGKSDLLLATEASLVHAHLGIRKTLAHIQATAQILNLIAKTQLPGNPSPPLFALLSAYLSHLPETPFPETFALSFSLKLWKHEGTLNLPEGSFSAEELSTTSTLIHARQFAELTALGNTKPLANKLSLLQLIDF